MSNVNSEKAYNYIRKKILSGAFAPGRSLMTMELADEIGVSRTPVRDGLRQLEADGLVSIRPRLGASVKLMDMNEFREMCGLRLALESFAAGLAATNRSEADLHEMRYAVQAMRELTQQIIAADSEQQLLPELVREDIRFHIAIMTAAKNELIKKEILRLHLINRVVSGMSPSKAGEDKKIRDERKRLVLACHQEILEAIERREVPKAKMSMEHHIQDIIDYNLDQMARADNGSMGKKLTDEELVYTA